MLNSISKETIMSGRKSNSESSQTPPNEVPSSDSHNRNPDPSKFYANEGSEEEFEEEQLEVRDSDFKGNRARKKINVAKKDFNLRPRIKEPQPCSPKGEGGVPELPVFSLTLTKEEIEEDFLHMTGALPPKKPKRRPKTEQKHVDEIFPGLFLNNVHPDSYRVCGDPPHNRKC